MKPTHDVKSNERIRTLRLKRETLRELAAGELKQAQGGARRTEFCPSERACGGHTKRCDRA